MNLPNNIKYGIILSFIELILIFVFAFSWYFEFPYDTFVEHHDSVEHSFGAVHICFNCVFILIITALFMFTSAVFGEEVNLEIFNMGKINIKKKYVYILVVLVLLVMVYNVCKNTVSTMTSMYNQHIEYMNQYEKIEYERQSYYDMMWKTYLQKNNICEVNKNTFIEVTKIIMDGRSDGENVAWKMVHENLPISYTNFTMFYLDLSSFVQEHREGYYKLEVQAMDIVRNNNIMLDTFPNNVYNKFIEIEHMKFEPGFSSTHTNNVFKSKIEDIK